MSYEALINTITLVCLVLFGLWIVVHIVQAIGLLLIRRAYRLHRKNVFTIPFVPLKTRLFHELAVPQFLAAEAIQRGDLPPALHVLRFDVAVAGQYPGVTPSSAAPPAVTSTVSSNKVSVLTGSPLSSVTNTEDNKVKGSKKKISTVVGKSETHQNQIETDEPVAVAVNLEPAVLVSADTSNPSWWTAKLEGQNLVLGLQLPLQLQSSASRTLAARLEKELNSAAPITSMLARTDNSSSSSKRRGVVKEKSNNGPGGGASTSLRSQNRQPSVSLQFKHYRLTSTALLSPTIPLADGLYSPFSNLRNATRLEARRNNGPDSYTRRDARSAANGSQEVQAAIEAQLSTAPMQVRTRFMGGASIPRSTAFVYSLNTRSDSTQEERAGPLDFDAIRFAYLRHNQHLLEMAVAEQTAMAHLSQYDRKSAKRAQRIAAMLMQYLQYIHEDDEDETVLDDSLVEETGRGEGRNARGSLGTSKLQGRDSCLLTRGLNSVTGTGASSTRRRYNQSPWVPLLGDAANELGGVRHGDPLPAATGSSSRRLTQSFSQTSITTSTLFSAAQKKNRKFSGKATSTGFIPSPSQQQQPPPSPTAVITLSPLVHEPRRGTRKQREAAHNITDSAVDALEALVERVRQAQTLRPQYQALLFVVNFRAERFIVRRGASGPPSWTALSTSRTSTAKPGTLSSSYGVESGDAACHLPNSFRFTTHTKTKVRHPRRRHFNTGRSDFGEYDALPSDSVTGVSNCGVFASDAFFRDAKDDRTELGGSSKRSASPTWPSQSIKVPFNRKSNANPTDRTAMDSEDYGTAEETSASLKKNDPDVSSLVKVSPAMQTVPHILGAPTADGINAAPMLSGSAATDVTPRNSISANDSAMEFLRASRQCKAAADVASSQYASSAYPTKWSSNLYEGSDGMQSSPLRYEHQRHKGDTIMPNSSDVTGHSRASTLLRQNTSSVYSDGSSPRAPSTRADASQRKEPQPSSSAPKETDMIDALVPQATEPTEAVAAPSAPRGPCETDLRMVYIIGADRATLLRSLTLNATQTFSAGAQNFLCFFTHKDEQRARRRYLEKMDRQYRLELQLRLNERKQASVAGQDGNPPPEEESRSDSGFGGNTLRSYPMQGSPTAPSIVPSRTTSWLASGSLRHARGTSWHSVGLGGSVVFDSESCEPRENYGDPNPAPDSLDLRCAPSLSLHSLHSFAVDSATFNPPLLVTSNGNGGVLTVQTTTKESKSLNSSFCNVSNPNAPHSLEVSLHSSGDGVGLAAPRCNSTTGNVEAQGFETVLSLPSSTSSGNRSTESMPLQKDNTIANSDGPPKDRSNDDVAEVGDAHGHSNHNDGAVEGEQLRSFVSTDNVFVRSLHSLDSVVDNGVADPLTDNTNMARTSPSKAEILAIPTFVEKPAEAKAAIADAGKREAAALSYPPSREYTEAAEQRKKTGGAAARPVSDKVNARNKKASKERNASTLESAEMKVKARQPEKTPASDTVAAAVGSSILEETRVPASTALKKPTMSTRELSDPVGDHDVRLYHAAIGVTLPEQVFLLRDEHAESGLSPSANSNVPCSGGGSRSRRSTIQPYHSVSNSSYVCSSSVTGPQCRGVMRVLEGQVEVAELSLDVLDRQIGPFVPRKHPSVSTRSNSSAEDNSEDPTSSGYDGSSNDGDVYSRHRESYSPRSSCFSGDSDSDSDKHRRRINGKRQQHQQKTNPREKVKLSGEERKTRLSSQREQKSNRSSRGGRTSKQHYSPSRRDAKSSKPAAANRAERRRQRRRQQRRIAAWRHRILRKQAAANEADYSPVSVAVLFFTAPPELPIALIRRFEAQGAAYESSPLLIPSWALGSLAPTAPLGAPPLRVPDSPVAADQQQKEKKQPSICVTLVYTSTAEQVTQTLLAAHTMAASTKREERAVPSSSLENSFASYVSHTSNNCVGQRRGSWVDELREWQQHERRFSAATNRYHEGYEDDVFSPKDAASVNTSPPSPTDSLCVLGHSKGMNSFPNSLAMLSSPPAELGTATFAGDKTSSFSSDKQAAEKLSPSPKIGQSGRQSNENSNDGSHNETAATATAPSEKSPPLPPLLLLTESTDSVNNSGDFGASTHAHDEPAEGISRTSTSVFMDPNGSFNTHRIRKADTMCFDEDMLTAVSADKHNNSRAYRITEAGGTPRGEGTACFAEDSNDHERKRKLATTANSVVDVLRDSTSFPDGVPIGVSLTYVRIGNDLYAVTEVVDRTFLQYREERVIHPNVKKSAVNDDMSSDAVSVLSAVSSFSDSSEDVEPRSGDLTRLNTSFASDTPFSTLDAALQAIQTQHEATARQQRRRMNRRRRAVSTMNFGDLSYSLAGSAPVRPGTRRQEVHMCWRCLSAEAAVIFLPCGHYAVCEGCAEVLADCCVCKTPILSSVVLLERKKTRRTASSPTRQQQPQQQRQSSLRHRSACEQRSEQ